MTATFFKAVAGIATAAAWITGMIILVMADTGGLPNYPYGIIGGVIAMFSCFATLVIVFAHAVTTTSKDPREN